MSEITQKVDQLNKLLFEIRDYKAAHPDERVGYYYSFRSLLNAYREGDIDFESCIAEFEKIGTRCTFTGCNGIPVACAGCLRRIQSQQETDLMTAREIGAEEAMATPATDKPAGYQWEQVEIDGEVRTIALTQGNRDIMLATGCDGSAWLEFAPTAATMILNAVNQRKNHAKEVAEVVANALAQAATGAKGSMTCNCEADRHENCDHAWNCAVVYAARFAAIVCGEEGK